MIPKQLNLFTSAHISPRQLTIVLGGNYYYALAKFSNTALIEAICNQYSFDRPNQTPRKYETYNETYANLLAFSFHDYYSNVYRMALRLE
jgi:hypothetical protein